MPRVARETLGGYVYHVINRGVGRMKVFEKDADFETFGAHSGTGLPCRKAAATEYGHKKVAGVVK